MAELQHLPKEPPPVWGPATQWVLAGLVAVALSLAAWHSVGRVAWTTPPFPVHKGVVPLAPIDLNRATAEQFAAIPGLGPALARRIVDHRREHGPYRDLGALLLVRGIGPGILERIRPFLFVEGQTPSPTVVRGARPDEKPGRKPLPTEKVDLNRATAKQLLTLPGIGPVLAARILEARDRAPFQSVDELRRVRGIGAKTLERLRPYAIVLPDPP